MATCVGEEGLDIGEVDLIVCFDAAKSPIRLVQRMGRTGRKRDGRIVVIVAEGKEDQIYNKSQSNKKSIHRAIKEGCRNLVFFQQCPRMVPRYISPQVHKMHMTIGDFVSSKAGKRNTSSNVLDKCLSSASQSKLGFTASKNKRGNKHGFLSNDELTCWSNELALSDREFRTLEKSVDHCFPTTTEFLSITKLRGEAASNSQRNSFADMNASFANSSLNSSTSQMRKKFYLSLNRWSVCQTAPIPTAVVGHSSKTQLLTSTLEFIDLLHSADGVGQSYDLEMETFLNQDDILKRNDHSGNKKGGNFQKKKKKVRSVCKFLEDSSDEEPMCVLKKLKSNEMCESTAETATFEASSNSAVDLSGEDDKDGSDLVNCEPSVNKSSPVSKQPVAVDNSLTASQHVVPRAPSVDSLDWLDEVDPTQMPAPLQDKEDCLTSAKTSSNVSESASKIDNFQFVTPKAPLSARRSKIQASSTPICSEAATMAAVSSPMNDNLVLEAIAGFDDLSANAIFDDFSDTSLLSSSRQECHEDVNLHMEDECATRPANSTSISKGAGQISISETSKLVEDCVVIDSDSEDEKGDDGIQISRPLKSAQDTSCMSDDSFLQVHRQRRKKAFKAVNHLLESPSTSPSHVGASTKPVTTVSPGSKENASTIVQQSSEWLSSRHTRNKNQKKVTRFNLSDSSDDDLIDVPLMQRIGRKTTTCKTTSDRTTKCPEPKRKREKAKPRKRKLVDGFVEEEADVSSGEEGQSDNEPSLPLHDSDSYDIEDSFINDNSMLTQISPSQKECIHSKSKHTCASSHGLYLRSLMSPEDHLFRGRRRVDRNNNFRMVLSQRHQILNHYIKKAGFNVADSARKVTRQRRRKERTDSMEDESHSEAEEMNYHYGDEDCVELSHSQSLTDVSEHSSSRISSDGKVVEERTPLVKTRKRRPRFLSDSDDDSVMSLRDQAVGTSASKRLRLSSSSSPKENEVATVSRQSTSSTATEITQAEHSASLSKTPLKINREVVSQSLLVSLYDT